MKLLLDTYLLLWATEKSVRLPPVAAKSIEDPANELFFSAASIREIAIKHAKKAPGFKIDPALFSKGPIGK